MITNLSIGNAGRFGNQLFQLAALIGVGYKTGYDVKIPIENTNNIFTFYDLAKQQAEPTGMELLIPFDIPHSYFITTEEILSAVKQRYNEPFFQFDSSVFKIPDNTDMSGYFQSEKYFKHCEETIRSVFTFRTEIKTKAQELMNQLSPNPKVSLHVRRGDYVANAMNHTVTGLEYYGDAINKFFIDDDYEFVIFSDDPNWCKEWFEGATVVDVNNSYIEMCMMSMCDHHIIANSSFSWWGAWLNPSPTKIVTAPSVWFGPNLRHNNITDLLPEGWFWI